MRINIIVFFIIIIFGCNPPKDKSEDEEKWIPYYTPSRSILSLKEDVIYKGDTVAYDEYRIANLDSDFQAELLYFAMIMANRYDYTQAYYDVFDCFVISYISDMSQIDEQSADIAIDYLLKAYERGHHQASWKVDKYSISRDEDSRKQMQRMYK